MHSKLYTMVHFTNDCTLFGKKILGTLRNDKTYSSIGSLLVQKNLNSTDKEDVNLNHTQLLELKGQILLKEARPS